MNQKSMMGFTAAWMEALGFSDIEYRDDGTCNVTLGNERFYGLYISDIGYNKKRGPIEKIRFEYAHK